MTTAKPDYVYVTYIASTPEKVWEAITEPRVTGKYWNDPKWDAAHPAHVNVSDWMVGSTWEHQRADASLQVDVVGKVLECNAPNLLVVSWASPAHANDPGKTSKVTFEIMAYAAGLVRLRVIHDELEPDSKMLASISGGWPMVLSGLKSYLETGKVLAPA